MQLGTVCGQECRSLQIGNEEGLEGRVFVLLALLRIIRRIGSSGVTPSWDGHRKPFHFLTLKTL